MITLEGLTEIVEFTLQHFGVECEFLSPALHDFEKEVLEGQSFSCAPLVANIGMLSVFLAFVFERSGNGIETIYIVSDSEEAEDEIIEWLALVKEKFSSHCSFSSRLFKDTGETGKLGSFLGRQKELHGELKSRFSVVS